MSRSAARTARSASALARKNRVRWNSVAPIAEKKTKRPTLVDSAARSRRAVPRPLISSTDGLRLVADRGREVDHGVDPPQRLARDPRIAKLAEVTERDPHLDPQPAELAGIAHQHTDVVAALE